MKNHEFSAICSIFGGPFLTRVSEGTHVAAIRELGDDFREFWPPSDDSTLSEWFDFFYNVLFENYRTEYIYKNLIATKLYLKNCSLGDSLYVNEMRVGGSKADIVIFDDTSIVFEIKSRHDTFDRLESQISNYKKAFDEIVLITTKENMDIALKCVDETVGVVVVGEAGNIFTIRIPGLNRMYTDPETIFSCMRRAEYCNATKEAFGYLPSVSSARLYRASSNLYKDLPPDIAHDLMVKQLRARIKSQPFRDLIDCAPHSLKHACLSYNGTQTSANIIKRRL